MIHRNIHLSLLVGIRTCKSCNLYVITDNRFCIGYHLFLRLRKIPIYYHVLSHSCKRQFYVFALFCYAICNMLLLYKS